VLWTPRNISSWAALTPIAVGDVYIFKYLCMCVCKYVCVYIYTHVYTYMDPEKYDFVSCIDPNRGTQYVYMHLSVFVCVCVCVYMYIHISIFICMSK